MDAFFTAPFVSVETLPQNERIGIAIYGGGDIIAVIPGYDVTKFNLWRGRGRQRRGTATKKYHVHFEPFNSKTITAYNDAEAIERANSYVNGELPMPEISENLLFCEDLA